MKNLHLALELFNEGVYYCVEGDTLISIAKRFSTSSEIIIKDNNLYGDIKSGDALYIKRYKRVYVVKVGDTAETVAKMLNLSTDEMFAVNKTNYIYPYLTVVSDKE